MRMTPNKPVKASKETLQEIEKLTDELHPSVHFDFTPQIESTMNRYKQYCEDAGYRLPIRQFMWDLYAVTMLMHITDTLCKGYQRNDYPNDKYTNMDATKLIELARDELTKILTGDHDKKLISEEQEDISNYEYTNSQKLLNILKSTYLSSIAFLKLRDYEKLFVVPDELETTTCET